ncbi:MAG: glycerophosphodiester phosphodiesterase, partial [Anaerolineae bacterium]|nr:glycerophosphodiester phosphodiesterase [Anaerolineae bacterium]
GERIPTLEEVLAEVGHKLLINIELKDFSLKGCGLEETVVALLRQMGMLKRVWFSSFNPMSLRRVRNYTQAVPCGLLYAENLSVSLWDKGLTFLVSYEALHPHHTLINAQMMQEHKYPNGELSGGESICRVAAWTVDVPERAVELAALGVDAIITNKPAEILEALE